MSNFHKLAKAILQKATSKENDKKTIKLLVIWPEHF